MKNGRIFDVNLGIVYSFKLDIIEGCCPKLVFISLGQNKAFRELLKITLLKEFKDKQFKPL